MSFGSRRQRWDGDPLRRRVGVRPPLTAARGLSFWLAAVAIALVPLLLTHGIATAHEGPGLAAQPSEADASLALHDCLFSGVNFVDQQDRLFGEGWVPDGWELFDQFFEPLGGTGAVVLVWTLKCASADSVEVDGGVGLSIVGAAIDFMDFADPTEWHNFLAYPALSVALWGVYVVEAHTDQAEVTEFLAANGMPARTVPSIELSEQPIGPELPGIAVPLPAAIDTCGPIGELPGIGHSLPDELRPPEPTRASTARVAPDDGPFETVTTTWVHHNTLTHCHDQMLWHGRADAPGSLRMVVPTARDHFCTLDMLPGCGVARATPGSTLHGLLGAEERDDSFFAFDHERIPTVHLVGSESAADRAAGNSPGAALDTNTGRTRGSTLPATGGSAVAGLALVLSGLMRRGARR